jgi:hypothetical protein
MECLPFQTFGDVLSDSLQRKSNILMNPINAFFNKTEEIFSPLKQVPWGRDVLLLVFI